MFYDPPRPRCTKLDADGCRCLQPKHDESKPHDWALFPWPGATTRNNRGELVAVDGVNRAAEQRWGPL